MNCSELGIRHEPNPPKVGDDSPDMLDIKVWLDGESVEITGTIPLEDTDVVTTSS